MPFEIFVSPRKLPLPPVPSKPVNFPTLPEEYHRNKRKLSDAQVAEAKEMLRDHSQRYVASHFNVSRHVILMHCVEGYAERFRKTYKHVAAHPDTERAARKRRRQLIKQLKPHDVKLAQQANNLYYRRKNAKQNL